jgi:NAD+ kinase
VNRILILPNLTKAAAIELADTIIPLFEAHGFELVLEKVTAQGLNRPLLGKEEEKLWDGIDMVLVLGGDGSILNAARRIYPCQIPILGVNLGQLGFLTRIESNKIEKAVEDLRCGKYQLEKRSMLRACVKNGTDGLLEIVALNDLIVTAKSPARMIRLDLWADNELFATYPADGLIVATATGSTAYSLSAGGPILDPRLEAILVTPICAHSLYARPVVFNPEARLKIILHQNNVEVSLTADGQTGTTLQPGAEICFEQAPYITQLIRFEGQGLFEALKSRLKEGRI